MILLSLVIVVVATVLLLLGVSSGALGLVLASMGLCVAALVLVFIANRLARPPAPVVADRGS